MIFKKRIVTVLVILICVFLVFFFLKREGISKPSDLLIGKDTIHIWYADEELTDYMNAAAVAFNEKNHTRVVPMYVTGLDYLDAVNEASIEEKDLPDLFVITNDTLEKAYLSGLAAPILDSEQISNSSIYPDTALNAVTYQDKILGYPFYYETSFLLYNKTYVDDVARAAIELDEEHQATENEIDGMAKKVIPQTIDDILEFANNFDAPENVEAVLKWDVTDIFYNYFMVGNYVIVGGETGDDIENIHIYNQDTIECLKVYQNLNQFFSINPKEVNYESVIQDFIDGKIIFTVATTDAITTIEEAKQKGEFPFEYGVTTLPDASDALKTRSLSVTNAVVVNGYSNKKELANQFAKFISCDYVEELYAKSTKVPSKKDISYDNPALYHVMEEYENSISMPKMMETSHFWMQMEIAFTKIWMGADVDSTLKKLSEQGE